MIRPDENRLGRIAQFDDLFHERVSDVASPKRLPPECRELRRAGKLPDGDLDKPGKAERASDRSRNNDPTKCDASLPDRPGSLSDKVGEGNAQRGERGQDIVAELPPRDGHHRPFERKGDNPDHDDPRGGALPPQPEALSSAPQAFPTSPHRAA